MQRNKDRYNASKSDATPQRQMPSLKAGCNVTKTDENSQRRMPHHKDGRTLYTRTRNQHRDADICRRFMRPTEGRNEILDIEAFISGVMSAQGRISIAPLDRHPFLTVAELADWELQRSPERSREDQDCEDQKNNEDGEHHKNHVGMTRILKFVGMRRT